MFVILMVEETVYTRWFTVRRQRAAEMQLADRFDRIYKRVPYVEVRNPDKTHYEDVMHLSWASDDAPRALDPTSASPIEVCYRQAIEKFEREQREDPSMRVFSYPAYLRADMRGGSIVPVDFVVYCNDYE
jgi:hypothetical protein